MTKTAAATRTKLQLVRERDGPEGIQSTVVAPSLEVAGTFLSRFLGLMGRRQLDAGAALWLEPCSSIHMMFMRFRIDAVFVDTAGVVLKVSTGVRPWIGLAACGGARSVIELESGAATRAGLALGDRLLRREVAA